LLQPDEQLRFAFPVGIKQGFRKALRYAIAERGSNDGNAFVVISDRSLLLVDKQEQLLDRDRLLYADLPLPRTLGPVTGYGTIVLDGRRVFVPGGRKIIERAEAALKTAR
jgi:hypothetical protein